jgi:hypothetical protein
MGSGERKQMIPAAILILVAASMANAAKPVAEMDAEPIQKLAAKAKNSAEHAAVAEQWESRASAFEAQAVKLEREADEMLRREGYNPMRHKWPAMAQAPVERLRAKAMQARRAAFESKELMAYHRNLAEKLSTGQ